MSDKKRPFHETIIGAINVASTAEQVTQIHYLLRMTKIPKGHEQIIQALMARADKGPFMPGVVECIVEDLRVEQEEPPSRTS
ncbi:MAG: hypothetical protein V1821_02705 [bacterium]